MFPMDHTQLQQRIDSNHKYTDPSADNCLRYWYQGLNLLISLVIGGGLWKLLLNNISGWQCKHYKMSLLHWDIKPHCHALCLINAHATF